MFEQHRTQHPLAQRTKFDTRKSSSDEPPPHSPINAEQKHTNDELPLSFPVYKPKQQGKR